MTSEKALRCSSTTSISNQFVNFHEDNNDDDIIVSEMALGHPGGRMASTTFGEVAIENSSDVHIGDQNVYNGPVTIRQIVYATGSSASDDDDKDKKDLEFESGSDDLEKVTPTNEECGVSKMGLGKGFMWLKKVSKRRSIKFKIFVLVVMVLFVVVLTVMLLKHAEDKLHMVTREEWGARPPSGQTAQLVTPVPIVIIHHTDTGNCFSKEQCVLSVRVIQAFHMDSNGWSDIGYNFLVGGDGFAYEGRGWTVQGAHTHGWNSKSIGIAFIGNFNKSAPVDIQISACFKLVNQGMELGYIPKDYRIVAARQLIDTDSPGDVLFEEMKKWEHWS